MMQVMNREARTGVVWLKFFSKVNASQD